MANSEKRSAMDWIGFAGILLLVTIVSFFIHEQGHYLMGAALGFDMWFNLNSAGTTDQPPPTDFQQTFITMAGPTVTVIQAFIAAALIRNR